MNNASRRRLRLVPHAADVGARPGDGDGDDVDKALLAALRRGEPGAAGQLWDRYAPFVRGLLVRTLGPSADIDDLVQEVFMRLYERLPTLRDPGAVRGYTAIAALSAARSELRRRRVRRLYMWWPGRSGATEATDSVAVLPADLATRQALLRLHAALDQLSPEDRLVFCLRYIEVMELTAVAETLELSLATTKRHLARAKRRLWLLAGRDPTLAPYLVDGSSEEGADP